MLESTLLSKRLALIGGRRLPAHSGDTFPVHNPATGEHLADVPRMGTEEAVSAIEAARAAMNSQVSLGARAEWLKKISALLFDQQEELGRIITLEHGKPWREAIVEVQYAAGFFSFFGDQLDKLKHHKLPEPINGARWEIHVRPAGVVGSITPWNFPLAMMAKKLAPAIGAGCGVVAKPASQTPLSAIAFCTLAQEAGIPNGLLNVVIGSAGPIAEALCRHAAVRLISK